MREGIVEDWEREVMAGHRWQRIGEEAARTEVERLRVLRAKCGNLNDGQRAVLGQVICPEICNWALFEMASRVCAVIGSGRADPRGTGHRESLSPERMRQIWAYYLACRYWVTDGMLSYRSLLDLCDPEGKTRKHVAQLLGSRDAVKDLYVERFCITLEAWLDDVPFKDRPRKIGLHAAAQALEARILSEEATPRVPFDMIRLDDHSILEPCHHKVLRRYDIILSSIGDGQWRKSMPLRGTDGADRAAEMEPYLLALERWTSAEEAPAPNGHPESELYPLLGRADAFKRFAVALLASLLRAQQMSARQRGR